ncbi:hypothetical protein C3418_01360 [Aeromonas sp. ASNIH8]|uniref:hypothetical protein n=1 Tax=Aeromonas sp. ASNIH8 TaxID=1920113 RepID=UPI000CDD92E2|nr:hypothetical protein [Aeromonas sp. ASNIH8]POV93674.1 hypothetical protein C3418_01360 [Aeromonas sp. ASNIH8]
MHVILLTALCGEKRGNVGDKLPVASQEEADELVRLGIARYDTEAELKRQLAELQAREQQRQEADALAAAQALAAEGEAAEEAERKAAEEAEQKAAKQVKAKADKA